MNKKSLLVSIITILLPAISFAGNFNGWIYQNPYPTSNTLLAVKFVTPKKGWIAGEKGTILYTEDGGDTWEAQESGTGHDIRSLAFVNEKTGWAVGNGGTIIHTENGGKTWASQGGSETVPLNKVFFVTDKEGWAVGMSGLVLNTKDGGEKWEKQEIGIKRAIASIYFINPKTGWILAGDEVYRTIDGGKNWEKGKLQIQIPQAGAMGGSHLMYAMGEGIPYDWPQGDICFNDDKHGWAVVGLWFIFYTEDGGKTWGTKDLGYMSYGLGNIAFANTTEGCATGSSILCTKDGGKTWEEKLGIGAGDRGLLLDSLRVDLGGITYVNSNEGWVVGMDGVIAKTDKKGNWIVKTTRPLGESVYPAYFQSPEIGWTTRRGNIVGTNDGGRSWTDQKEFNTPFSMNFFFTNANIGWAIGWQWDNAPNFTYKIIKALILHTNDGGKTWISQFDKPGDKLALFDASFINAKTGWVVGSKGTILHTADGGKHWKQQKSGTKFRLERVQFVDEKIGWAIGVNGSGATVRLDKKDAREWIILYTEDGGNHWQTQWKKAGPWLNDLFFVDKTTGWIIGTARDAKGDHGLMIYTKDGGKTWIERDIEVDQPVIPVNPYFVDRDRGWIQLFDVNNDKLIERLLLMTTDGGKTWKEQKTGLHKYPWKPF